MNSAATTAAILGVSAVATALVITNASNAGPLNPPPGPVTETTPSLAELRQQLDDIETTLASITGTIPQPDFQSVYIPNASTTTFTALAETVFLRTVVIDQGGIEIIDGQGDIVVRCFAGGADATIGGPIGGFQLDLELVVEGPVQVRRVSALATNPTLIYTEVPTP